MSQLVTESAGAMEQLALCETAREEASSKPPRARTARSSEPTAAELETLARWGWVKLSEVFWKDPSSGGKRRWDSALKLIAKGEARGDLPGDVATAEPANDVTPPLPAEVVTTIDSRGYEAFIRAKHAAVSSVGFDAGPVHPMLFPFQADAVRWALAKGRAGLFESFGLGKTFQQLEIGRQVCASRDGARFLIIAPLGVRQEFARDAETLGIPLRVIRTTAEVDAAGVYLTHYEAVRDGKLDPSLFLGVSLDEASCLRGFGGTKTFREFMALLAGDDRRDMTSRKVTEGIRYRFVASATPSPNDLIELLAYAAFLGVMDISTAKTRFFLRDSEQADNLTLNPRKAREFWLWVSSWGLFITKPSDLGYSDDGYALPELRVHWHMVQTDHRARAGIEKPDHCGRAQAKMFVDAAAGIQDAAREARASLDDRISKMLEIRAENPEAHRVIWHDLEDERRAIERAIPSVVSVFGTQDVEDRVDLIRDFADGKVAELAAKPVMLGSGCNFQRHCAEAIFLGVSYKFNDFIQAIHRLYRFLQSQPVDIHIIYTEAQDGIRRALEGKWTQHNELVAQMTAIIREHGLSGSRAIEMLRDKTDVTRAEVRGDRFTLVHNDCVRECAAMAENSVDHIATSIPFSTQYKYSDSYLDFGHSDTNEHFWRQMGYLIPNLLRVLKPGRIAAIHVKDRIVPGGMQRPVPQSFQTVYPFHADAITHFCAAGFAYMGMITVVTDVVRENAQTYRLAYKELRKDTTKMGVGMPEYVLLFRKPPTGTENSYADEPVTKTREEFSLSRWQIDAHAFWRSAGNRLITPADLAGFDHAEMFQRFAAWSRENVYDFASHVALNEALAAEGELPTGFMLFQPQSTSPDVWTDVARMRTFNTLQAAQERIQHLCPLPFDIVERLIERFTNKGETVLDPFSGLGTVPYCAVKQGRRGLGVELSPEYFAEAVRYLRAIEAKMSVPTLFDLGEAIAAGESCG